MASRVLYAVTWSKAHWYIHRDGDIRPQDRKEVHLLQPMHDAYWQTKWHTPGYYSNKSYRLKPCTVRST